MLDFTNEEIVMLVEDGYTAGYMMDIREGDLIAIAPVMRTNFEGGIVPVKSLTVQRIMHLRSDYRDTETDELVEHTVIVFIGIDLDGLPQHCSYGNTYPCFIKREEQQKALPPGTTREA